MKRVLVLLTTAALIAGLAGCQADPVQVKLDISSTSGGTVTNPGEGEFTYQSGTVVDLVAEAEAGYRFGRWTGHTFTIDDVDAAETTIVVDSHYKVTANFIAQYELTVLSTGGGEVVIPGEATFTYDHGTVVSLVATPASGYRFVSWTGDIGTVSDVNAASTSVTMTSNCVVVANFEELLKVWDWYGLHAVRYNMSGSYILMKHLDSTTHGYQELASPTANDGNGWEPIGALDNGFLGTFDGQGYEIRDVFVHRPDESNVGLFAVVYERGSVENLGMVSCDVTGGTSSVGGLVGFNRGHVSKSYFCGSVIGINGVGGLVGVISAAGIVTNCHYSGRVSGHSSVGGLVGQNSGIVTRSYSTGSVTGNQLVGGLVGVNWIASIDSSYSESGVIGTWAVGGLAGQNYGGSTLMNSHSSGDVTGDSAVGGLVGTNTDLAWMRNSYSSGTVTGGINVGGLVGENQGRVSSCFWDIEASGAERSGGGFGKTTAQMQDITTFAGAGWDIAAVIAGDTDPACLWNIVDGQTYPFLNWQSAP